MGFSIATLNQIRATASADYQARIPVATQDNIAQIGNAFKAYTLLYNEFCEALFNKIGKTQLESKLFKNKLARFKSGAITDAQDVEEIFVDMGNAANAYDPDGKNPLGRRSPSEVKAYYHRQNRRDEYAISLGDIDFRRTFMSEATLDSFISAQLNSVYSRANHDEWLLMKELLATYKNEEGDACGYCEYEVPALTATNAAEAAKTFVKTLRKASQDISFASRSFNKAGVMTWSDPSQMTLLINKDMLAELDVEVLAKAFNLGKTDIEHSIVTMDDFGSLTDTYGLLIDKDFFRVYDTLSHMEPQRNAQGLFTNYFYHVHQILSLSPYKNAIRFKAVSGS